MSKNTGVKETRHFHFDLAEKKIVGTRAAFNKANKGVGEAYDQLADLMTKQPTFTFEIIEPERSKRTYKGMDIAFMRDFLIANDDLITLKTLDDVVAFAEASGKSKYPLAKRVLFGIYDCFDYAEAQSLVDDYRFQQTKAQADAMAAAIAADKAAKEAKKNAASAAA